MSTITGANTEQPAFDSAFEKTFSRIHGRSTRQDWGTFHKEVEHVLVNIRVPSFERSNKYGLLAEARTQTAYTNLSTKMYYEPSRTEPTMTHPTISEAKYEFDKEKKKAERDGWCTLWYTQRSALKAVCHTIREALDEAHYEQL